jgi:hypothetical protein
VRGGLASRADRRGRPRLKNSGFEENRFERGLDRLLDGIELDLKRR